MKKQAFITFHGTIIAKKAVWTAALAALLYPVMSRGQASKPSPSPIPPPSLPWQPPDTGDDDFGTKNTVTGEARGGGEPDVMLVALVPNSVAFTTHEQPSLFWYQSKQASARLEIALIEPGKPQPLMVVGSPSAMPGIHRVRLANHGVKLAPGVKYKWSVSLISDPSSRSLDEVVNGTLKRIEPSKELTKELAGASATDRPAIYAQAGVWYDALEAISDEIDANPKDNSLRRKRVDLLKQAGLPVTE